MTTPVRINPPIPRQRMVTRNVPFSQIIVMIGLFAAARGRRWLLLRRSAYPRLICRVEARGGANGREGPYLQSKVPVSTPSIQAPLPSRAGARRHISGRRDRIGRDVAVMISVVWIVIRSNDVTGDHAHPIAMTAPVPAPAIGVGRGYGCDQHCGDCDKGEDFFHGNTAAEHQ
jgi:hypothetical protein